MAITLPTYPGPRSASLRPVDAGSWQQATLGGDDIRLDRLGDRFALAVQMPPMKWHKIGDVSAARVWASRLARGVSEKVIFEVPQPDYSPPAIVDVTVSAAVAAQAITVPCTGAGDGTVFPEGIFVTIRTNATGRHYLHQLRATATSVGGAVSFSLWPRIRTALVASDTILIQTPVIEGRILEAPPSDMDEIRMVGIAFEIQEAR